MSTTDERLLLALRFQAWERAKGELQALLHTYFQEAAFDDVAAAIEEFISKMQDHWLY
uniref:Uncharacterized protein n=1 Tax=Ralstonia pickettii (strain 12D) TaxID=428406 RepID=C6BC93_RALP1